MLSVVIPVFNEAESLATLHRELAEVAAAEGYDLDLVFVDDGSTRRLVGGDPPAWPTARSAGARHPLPPQLRQGGRAERRLRRRPGASW